MVVGIGMPINVADTSVTVGATLKNYYLLPTNSTDYTSPTINYARKRKSVSRSAIYELISSFLQK